MTDSPIRRLTSVYDLENQVGTVWISLEVSGYMPGILPRERVVPF